MDKKIFNSYVELVINELRKIIVNENDYSISNKTTPTEFEKLVVEVSNLVNEKFEYSFNIEYTEGGHVFPDIIYNYKNNKYGIEVKSSTSTNTSNNSWTILGNSILGSTRIDVEETYIIFFKVNKNGRFINYARYEDAVSDIVVTHSPRYKLNLSQKPKDSFFEKSGISYKQLNESKDPIGLVMNYFKDQGETAWWIAESTPATIKNWSDICDERKKEIMSKAFVLFPELIYLNNNVKYKRLVKWLVANYSIVDSSLRDRFTAGGRINIKIDKVNYCGLPRIYETLINTMGEFKKQIEEISYEEIKNYWADYCPITDDCKSRKKYWIETVNGKLYEIGHSKVEIDFLTTLFSKINRP